MLLWMGPATYLANADNVTDYLIYLTPDILDLMTEINLLEFFSLLSYDMI